MQPSADVSTGDADEEEASSVLRRAGQPPASQILRGRRPIVAPGLGTRRGAVRGPALEEQAQCGPSRGGGRQRSAPPAGRSS